MNFTAEVLNVRIAAIKENGEEIKVSRIELGAYHISESVNQLVNEEVTIKIGDDLKLPVTIKRLNISVKKVDKFINCRYYKLEVLYRGVEDRLGQLVNHEFEVELS